MPQPQEAAFEAVSCGFSSDSERGGVLQAQLEYDILNSGEGKGSC